MFKTETLIRSLIIAALTAVAAGASPAVADVRLNYDTGIDARATANGIAALNVRPNAPSKVPAEMARLFPASHRAESLRFFNNALRKYPKRAEALQITNPYNVAEAFYYATYQAYRLYNGQVPTTLPDIYATRWKILPAFGRMGWLVAAPESPHRTLFDRYDAHLRRFTHRPLRLRNALAFFRPVRRADSNARRCLFAQSAV